MYIRPSLYWLNADEIENRLFKILVKKNNCHGDAILISSKLKLWDSLSSSFIQYSKHNLKYTKHKQKINFKFFFISFLVSNLKNGANIFTALIDFDGSYQKNCSSPLNINYKLQWRYILSITGGPFININKATWELSNNMFPETGKSNVHN